MTSVVEIARGGALHAIQPDGLAEQGGPLHPDTDHAEAHAIARRALGWLPGSVRDGRGDQRVAHERCAGDGRADAKKFAAREGVLAHILSSGYSVFGCGNGKQFNSIVRKCGRMFYLASSHTDD